MHINVHIAVGIIISGFLTFLAYLGLLIVNVTLGVRKKIMYIVAIIIVVCCIVGVSLIPFYGEWNEIERVAYFVMETIALTAGIGSLIAIKKAYEKMNQEKRREEREKLKKIDF